MQPEKLRAADRDTLRADIRYSFESGSPRSYSRYFSIDARTGVVTQTRAIQEKDGDDFEIVVKVRRAN